MPGFTTISDLADAENNGYVKYTSWRKSPTQATTIGIWFDLSMSPGAPVPQYYASAPLVGIPLRKSIDGGLDHGSDPIDGRKKYLRELMAMTITATALPMPMMLLDYLMYYPFIDEGITDPQAMDVGITPAVLPRYTDSRGVQMMAVSVAGRTGGQSFQVTYINSDGLQNRITQTVIENSVSLNGSIVTSDRAVTLARGPFIPLQSGDKGVQRIQSVQMNGADVGLFTLVLVKPIAQMSIRGIDAPVEIDYFKDFSQVPEIKNDAYLNFICCPAGSLAATAIYGDMKVIWN